MNATAADDVVMALVLMTLFVTAIAIWQWFRVRAAKKQLKTARSELNTVRDELRRTLVRHAADLASRDESHQRALTRLTEDFAFQTRSLRASMANSERKHRGVIQAVRRNEARLIDEAAQSKQALAEAQSENIALRSQVGYVPGLAARIRHDVPKGLRKLSAYLESVLPVEADRDFVKEELDMVMDKIELHLANEADIQKHVRETLRRITDEQAKQLPQAQRLVSLTQYLRYLVRAHRFQGVDFEAPEAAAEVCITNTSGPDALAPGS